MIHLPFITAYDPPGSSEGTLDPLGLYMIANQLATRLVPAWSDEERTVEQSCNEWPGIHFMVRKQEIKRQNGGRKSTASRFTHRQGQYLAYIYLYRKLHRIGPAQSDLARYFRVAPPTVHQMIATLKKLGLVVDEPGVARSIRVTIPNNEIPELEDESPHDD